MTAVPRAHSHVQYCVCIVMRTGSVLSLLCNACAVSTAAKKKLLLAVPHWFCYGGPLGKTKGASPLFFFFSRPVFLQLGSMFQDFKTSS